MAVHKRQKASISAPRSSVLTKVLVGLLLLSLLYIAGSVYIQQEEQMQRVLARQEELADSLSKAQASHKETQDLFDSMGTDYFIEKISREELGMLLPGEILFTD